MDRIDSNKPLQTPYYYTSSDSDEEQNESSTSVLTGAEASPSSIANLSPEEIGQLTSQAVTQSTSQFERAFDGYQKMTYEQATLYIETLIKGKEVQYLSPLNILFIDTMQLLRQLQHNKRKIPLGSALVRTGNIGSEVLDPKQLLEGLSLELHYLFRSFRGYSNLFNGQSQDKDRSKIIELQNIYAKTVNQFVRLEGAIESGSDASNKALCLKLKRNLDVLYHVCGNEDLLNRCSISSIPDLNAETSLLLYPPETTLAQFYLDSLDVCFDSMLLAKKTMQETFKDPIGPLIDRINKLSPSSRRHLSLNALIESLNKYQALWDEFLKNIPHQICTISMRAKTSSHNKQLMTYLQKIESGAIRLSQGIKEIDQIARAITEIWAPGSDLINKKESFYEPYTERTNEIDTLIEKIRKEIPKNSTKISKKDRLEIYAILQSTEELASYAGFAKIFNALIVETYRTPSLIVQTFQNYFSMLNHVYGKGDEFRQSLIADGPPPCSSFSPIDLLFQEIFHLFLKVEEAGESDADIIQKIFLEFQKCTKNLNNAGQLRCDFGILHQSLTRIAELTTGVLEDEMFDHQPLKIAVSSLRDYLGVYNEKRFYSPVFCQSLFSTIVDPLSNREELSDQDIPLVKSQINLLIWTTQRSNIDQHFALLTQLIQDQISKSQAGEKPFWKLNLKGLKLAQHEIKQRQALDALCAQKINTALDKETILAAIHKRDQDLQSGYRNYDVWTAQFALMGQAVLKDKKFATMFIPFAEICYHIDCVNWINTSFVEIIDLNPLPSPSPSLSSPKKPVKAPVYSPSLKKIEDSEKIVKKEKLPVAHTEKYQPSPQESVDALFDHLQQQPLSPLSDQEPLEAYLFRATRREQLIASSRFYLALIEEEKCLKPHSQVQNSPLQLRRQVDYFLLLEATEKIALSSLRIGTQENPDSHILTSNYSNRLLAYTHDGVKLVKIIRGAQKAWFKGKEIGDSIRAQEGELKRAYWFHQNHQPLHGDQSEIITCCRNVWDSLRSGRKASQEGDLYALQRNYRDMSTYIHQKNINEGNTNYPPQTPIKGGIESLENLLSSLESPSTLPADCVEIGKINQKAIQRVIDLAKELETYEGKDLTPLTYMVRSSEIQVSLLSLSLQFALSTLNIQAEGQHPLFLDHQGLKEGRPLHHSHRVDKLWEVLKRELNQPTSETAKMLDEHLSLFVGDPRYPYPNKTTMTNELVKTYEKVYLLQKIEAGGFFKPGDEQLLVQHQLGAKGWSQPRETEALLRDQVNTALANQENKLALAIDLTREILTLNQAEV